MKKGLPAVKNLGAPSKHLEFDAEEHEQEKLALKDIEMGESGAQEQDEEGEKEPESPKQKKVVPPTEDEYLWIWKVRILLAGVATYAHDLVRSRSWRLQGERSSCRQTMYRMRYARTIRRRRQVLRSVLEVPCLTGHSHSVLGEQRALYATW